MHNFACEVSHATVLLELAFAIMTTTSFAPWVVFITGWPHHHVHVLEEHGEAAGSGEGEASGQEAGMGGGKASPSWAEVRRASHRA